MSGDLVWCGPEIWKVGGLKHQTRHTIWNLVIGGLMYWLQANSVNQTMVQRYLALPTLRKAKWAVFLFCIGISVLYCFCLYCGLLIYARFYDCDPLQTKLAKAKDQLLPLLVMDVLGGIPGLPGIFLAGIFSAALSSLSTSLNSISAVVLEDFYKPFYSKQLSDRQTNWLLKGVVIVPSQWDLNWECSLWGALVGGLSGLVLMACWCLSAQMAIARGYITHPHKPLSTSGCL
ncbi:unnamed protein product [Leptidea sinapis]|uniref:Sodium/solute symporter n=1 Tax=Leptidea sinapis TaxID=189913 RepID=A0A5E4QD82_9NEOP|nr:unnamed protein product [Leptidea sinapis]